MKKTISFKIQESVLSIARTQAKKQNRSLSNHIETCILNSGRNQFAAVLKDETQVMRGIHNYLLDTYYEIKGVEVDGCFSDGEVFKFTNPYDFLNYVISVCEFMKESLKGEEEDNVG